MKSKIEDLPPILSVLTGSGLLVIDDKLMDEIAAVNVGSKIALVLYTSTDSSSVNVMSLVNRLNKMGYHVSDVMECDIGLIRILHENKTDIRQQAKTASVVASGKHIRIYDNLLDTALEYGASDIHVYITPTSAGIDMRINGLITHVMDWPRSLTIDVMRVVYTVLAANESKDTTFRMDEPQECVIDRVMNGKLVKIRYAHSPRYPGGLKISMRLLAMDRKIADGCLESLGYSDWQVKTLKNAYMSSGGAIVVSGPTNSGKSTSMKYMIMDMYEALNHEVSMYTIEDPPESIIHGATQVPARKVGNKNGMADFVKLVLRMDPDVIMIGEIRDSETGGVFQQCVQSGHRVFSTVHTDSALSIVSRLSESGIGVSRNVITMPGFISALVYQRLVPVTCPHCAMDYDDGYRVYHDLAKRALLYTSKDKLKFRNQESDCTHCRKGIIGQTVCAEIITPDKNMLTMMRDGKDISAIRYLRDKATHEDSSSFLGMDAMDHAITKMQKGLVCPSIIEALFERLGDADSTGGEVMFKRATSVGSA